jgi:broad specificity phosphatase PhoE
MTRLILIRHGETDWNTEGRWQGQIDIPLNENGLEHAQQLARELAGEGIQAIYSSNLLRAIQTADPLAKIAGLRVNIDPRLREIHQGEWQGMLVKDIQARYAERFQQRRANPLAIAPPGGETVLEVQQRVYNSLEDILLRHPDETVAIVAHGFVIAVLRVRLEKHPLEQVWGLIPPNGKWFTYQVE